MRYFAAILTLLLLAGGLVLLSNNQKSSAPVIYKDLIRVDTPKAYEVVQSPLVVRGAARGSWYFEASFPVVLVDANGLQLAVKPAQAQGDWMTPDYVPFEAVLNFSKPLTDTGTLILKKDNPSGLPENDDEVKIPIKFALSQPGATATPQTVTFGNNFSLQINSSALFPDGLGITLTEINDSRCPVGAQCIWQGELAPLLSLSGGSLVAQQQVKTGTVTATEVIVGNYKILLVSATAANAILQVEKTNSTAEGGLRVFAHVGPTCPVVQAGQEEKCADKPLSALFRIESASGVVKNIATGADGKFSLLLPVGDYKIRLNSRSALPTCPEVSVIIKANQYTDADIACDSGIR